MQIVAVAKIDPELRSVHRHALLTGGEQPSRRDAPTDRARTKVEGSEKSWAGGLEQHGWPDLQARVRAAAFRYASLLIVLPCALVIVRRRREVRGLGTGAGTGKIR